MAKKQQDGIIIPPMPEEPTISSFYGSEEDTLALEKELEAQTKRTRNKADNATPDAGAEKP